MPLIEGAAELGLDLQPVQARQLERYLRELLLWNAAFNLISTKTTPEKAIVHVLDCLSVIPHVRGGGPLLDLGSGGGLPAIPLKIVLPDLAVCMVESTRKKTSFLRQTVRLLDLKRISVLQERAELLDPEHRGAYSVVISRATFHLDRLLRIGAPFLAPDGILIAMKGPRPEEEIHEAEPNRTLLGLAPAVAHPIFLPRGGGARTVVIYGFAQGSNGGGRN
ncbi:MAG: 16S rRNA (guanine(527)-N(7))-methyltransferase RsmG [Syntrophales bacterium]|nr:16S rRNA (guanine(527)-N(7))-methyltransferase RsmG [Syntrophales bacterium]